MGKRKINITKELLFDLYIIKNMTAEEIANQFNVSIITINRYLKQFEIKKDLQLKNSKISQTKQNKSAEEKAIYSKHISEAMKRKSREKEPWNSGKKGCQKAWNKGMKMSDDFCNAVKESLANKTEAEKQAQKEHLSESLKGRKPWNAGTKMSPEEKHLFKQKLEQTCLNKYGVDSYAKTEDYLKKRNETHKKNNSFNASRPEDRYYEFLVAKYGEENVARQYFDSVRYPFNCDFYVKPLDLFIELNLNWTHGGERFNPGSYLCRIKLADWKEKAKTSYCYQNAIDTWTIRDIAKFKIAEENKLNYRVYYTEEELYGAE